MLGDDAVSATGVELDPPPPPPSPCKAISSKGAAPRPASAEELPPPPPPPSPSWVPLSEPDPPVPSLVPAMPSKLSTPHFLSVGGWLPAAPPLPAPAVPAPAAATATQGCPIYGGCGVVTIRAARVRRSHRFLPRWDPTLEPPPPPPPPPPATRMRSVVPKAPARRSLAPPPPPLNNVPAPLPLEPPAPASVSAPTAVSSVVPAPPTLSSNVVPDGAVEGAGHLRPLAPGPRRAVHRCGDRGGHGRSQTGALATGAVATGAGTTGDGADIGGDCAPAPPAAPHSVTVKVPPVGRLKVHGPTLAKVSVVVAPATVTVGAWTWQLGRPGPRREHSTGPDYGGDTGEPQAQRGSSGQADGVADRTRASNG